MDIFNFHHKQAQKLIGFMPTITMQMDNQVLKRNNGCNGKRANFFEENK
jgi:hypothetical protein